jgi:hypothetical protein
MTQNSIDNLISASYTAQTANYNVGDGDYLIECTANSFSVTLPTAVGIRNKSYEIKNSGSGTITLDTTASQTIDGELSLEIFEQENITVISNNVNWLIL